MENRLGGWRWKLDTPGEEVGSLAQMDKALCMTIVDEAKSVEQDLVKRLRSENHKINCSKNKSKKEKMTC